MTRIVCLILLIQTTSTKKTSWKLRTDSVPASTGALALPEEAEAEAEAVASGICSSIWIEASPDAATVSSAPKLEITAIGTQLWRTIISLII